MIKLTVSLTDGTDRIKLFLYGFKLQNVTAGNCI